MGIGRSNEVRENPELVPLGTPDELRALGYDLKAVRSCCVAKDGEIKGCMYAKKCSKLFGRPGTKYGGFGPPSDAPGTPGLGREHVPYYIRFSEGDEKEDQTWCYMFMGTIYNRMLASRIPDPETGETSGETIRLLGRAGEVSIVQDNYLSVPDPTAKGGRRMEPSTDVVKVEKADRIGSKKRLVASRKADMAARGEEFDGLDMDPMAESFAPEAEDAAVAAVAAEAPARRGRRRADDAD